MKGAQGNCVACDQMHPQTRNPYLVQTLFAPRGSQAFLFNDQSLAPLRSTTDASDERGVLQRHHQRRQHLQHMRLWFVANSWARAAYCRAFLQRSSSSLSVTHASFSRRRHRSRQGGTAAMPQWCLFVRRTQLQRSQVRDLLSQANRAQTPQCHCSRMHATPCGKDFPSPSFNTPTVAPLAL